MHAVAVRPSRWSALADPWFVIAVVVLVLNDHVLKTAAPGLVTGKLSDFAGLFVFAAILGVLIRSRSVSVAMSAIGFVALKTLPAVALMAAPLLGGVTRSDASDLVALVVLLPAWCWLRRTTNDGIETSGWRAIIGAVGGAAAVMSITATSCAAPSQVIHLGRASDGSVVAEVDDELRGGRSFARSVDGQHWTRAATKPAGPIGDARYACLSDGMCFRVAVGGGVQVRNSGRWRTAFRFSDEQNLRRDQRVGSCADSVPFFRSVAIVGSGVDEGVVVAIGSDGVLRRDARGGWHRQAVLGVTPARLDGSTVRGRFLLFSALAVVAMMGGVLVVGQLRSGRWLRGPAWTLLIFLGSMPVLGFLAFFGLDYTILDPLILAWVVLVALVALTLDRWLPDKGRLRRRGVRYERPLGAPAPRVVGVRAGWYPDPSSLNRLRWWDGESWSGAVVAKRRRAER